MTLSSSLSPFQPKWSCSVQHFKDVFTNRAKNIILENNAFIKYDYLCKQYKISHLVLLMLSPVAPPEIIHWAEPNGATKKSKSHN